MPPRTKPRAEAFYRKFGFVVVGSHAFVLGTDVQTDRLMARRLRRRSRETPAGSAETASR